MATLDLSGSQNFLDAHFGEKLAGSKIKNLALVSAGVFFLSLMAQFQIPLVPVPVTGQTLAILLIGCTFGYKRAFATTTAYLAVGAIGMPVFAGGAFGMARLMGPTGGFLVGFVAAATLMGFLAERKKDRTLKASLSLFTVGHLVIYVFGLIWLSFWVPAGQVFELGFFPFIPGLILKTTIASLVMSTLWKKSPITD